MTTKTKKPDLEAEVREQRLQTLEEEIDRLNNDIQVLAKMFDSLSYNLKETQQFAIKIGVAQTRIQNRVLNWPYVRIGGDEGRDGQDI
jgi:Ni,Fe-hydrogenase III large subunit